MTIGLYMLFQKYPSTTKKPALRWFLLPCNPHRAFPHPGILLFDQWIVFPPGLVIVLRRQNKT